MDWMPGEEGAGSTGELAMVRRRTPWTGLGINERSWAIADALAADADAHGVTVSTLRSGARVIDCGVQTIGGLEAGRALARASMGGLGHVAIAPGHVAGRSWPCVMVRTDHPGVACMGSQHDGWEIRTDHFVAHGAGPLRAAARVEATLYDLLGYSEHPPRGVLVLESGTLPDDRVAATVTEQSGLAPSALTMLVAAAASQAGGVQRVSRVLTWALRKLHGRGFDVRRVVSAIGTVPIAPVARGDASAVARTSDAIVLGGCVHLTARAPDDELAALAEWLPVATLDRDAPAAARGEPVTAGVAEVWITSATTGRTFHGGGVSPTALWASLGVEAP